MLVSAQYRLLPWASIARPTGELKRAAVPTPFAKPAPVMGFPASVETNAEEDTRLRQWE